MDDAELVGGVLLEAGDPKKAAATLAELLKAAPAAPDLVRRLGFDPDLLDVLRRRFSRHPTIIDQACAEGAAWVLGRRSVGLSEPWDLVATLPGGSSLPAGLRRTTGETLVRLVTGAHRSLRLVAPFMDEPGLRFLTDALTAATIRGVEVEVFLPIRSREATRVLADFLSRIRLEGKPALTTITRFREDSPWAHLKVVTADSTSAYVGSANITRPGLAGANLEMGVVLHGPRVRIIEQVLDLFREQ